MGDEVWGGKGKRSEAVRVIPSAHLPSPPLLPPLILSEPELEAFQTHGIHFSFRLCEGYKACRAEEMTVVDAGKRVPRILPLLRLFHSWRVWERTKWLQMVVYRDCSERTRGAPLKGQHAQGERSIEWTAPRPSLRRRSGTEAPGISWLRSRVGKRGPPLKGGCAGPRTRAGGTPAQTGSCNRQAAASHPSPASGPLQSPAGASNWFQGSEENWEGDSKLQAGFMEKLCAGLRKPRIN